MLVSNNEEKSKGQGVNSTYLHILSGSVLYIVKKNVLWSQ